MTTPFWCLLIVILMPYVMAGMGGYFKTRQFGSVDNNNPRQQSAALEGAGARAVAAQQNSWEALPVFAAAVIVAHLAGADPGLSAVAAGIFVAARVVYLVFYLSDIATARSLSFLVGFASCIWLFVLAARA